MLPLTPGTNVGPYIIESALGAGGMGIVYRAHDPRLSRSVAIKMLPSDSIQDEAARGRFLQEARVVSALDHPNICTIHDISETADGQLCLVMACYEGETLRQRMERGALPVNEAIDIVIQAAKGLARSHAAGVIHCDMKPANLMLTADGTVKILDFGVAKLTGAQVITYAEHTGSIVGTVAYMSPEQAMGQPVDQRSDLWSLGVVLYEMVAGARPFEGDNLLSLADAIRSANPRPLTGAAAMLNGVIDRALKKARDQRYGSGDELVRDLKAITAASDSVRTVVSAVSATPPADASSRARRTNVPRNLPRLFGRTELVAQVMGELRDHGVVTLVGFGGIGKTRVAQQVGTDALLAYPDGVWFADLSALGSSTELLPAVARVLGIKEYSSENLSVSITATLRERNLLILLDNCDRLSDAVAALIEDVIVSAPLVKFLATSRAPLGVYGERVVRVEALDESAAVALFEARATATRPGVAADRHIIVELCRRLDHLPLAIELAAVRVRSMTPAEILTRVAERFRMLRATDRRAARHQTLEAMVGWSYDLLPEQERQLLNRVSVFVGSFDLASAERVCAGSGVESVDVADLLDRLVDKSLVSAFGSGGVTRYRMMETVREYAARRLEDTGELEQIHDRHIRYFFSQAQTLGDRILGAGMRAASAALAFDIDNLNAAIGRLGQSGRHAEKAKLVGALELYWQTGGPSAGRRHYDELVEVLDHLEPPLQLSTLLSAASLLSNQGFATQSLQLLDRAEVVARSHALAMPPFFYYVAATVAEMDGRTDDVIRLCDAGAALTNDGEDEFVSVALRARVLTSIAKRRPDEALDHARTTLRLAEELGLDLFVAAAHMLIGTVHILEGRSDDADPEFARAIELSANALPQVVIAAKVAAAVGRWHHDAERSIGLAREALAIEEESDIMPVFRAVAADLVAWHWARQERQGDAAVVLASMDEMRRRLGFTGIWWAQSIRAEAWDLARQALASGGLSESMTRGRAIALVDLRRLLMNA